MGYKLRPKARKDISAIMSYIGKRNPRAALAWRDEIFRILDMLGQLPEAGAGHEEIGIGIRMFPKGNYVILYETEENGIAVIRVTHAARDREQLALR
jgi:toxin ParE1/3/4